MTDLLERTLLALLRADTGVPIGATDVLPGDARLLRVVDEIVEPILDELGPDEVRRHPSGELAARFGPDRDDGVLLQAYLVSQHGNAGAGADEARIVDGVAVGQGASQNKGAFAAAVAAIARLPRDLGRPVWFTVNLEGRSSHGGSRRIFDDLRVRAAHGVVLIATGLEVSLGNRGRVDLELALEGAAAHSSQPELGVNAIDLAADMVRLLREAPLPAPHPELGPAQLTPFRLEVGPVAPHTVPAWARIVLDRRLLPGETAEAARAHLDAWLRNRSAGPFRLEEGASMLPAAVSRAAPIVTALDAAGAAGTTWSRFTFDAGYACSIGIETVMFGPGRRTFGRGLLETESVEIDECRRAADVLADAVLAVSRR